MLQICIEVAVVLVSISILVICTWRFRRKKGYSSIPDEENVSDKLSRDREFQRLALKEALCQFFLNLSGKYTLVEQLSDIGCRLGRSWFIVRQTKSEKRLLVLTKQSSECCLSLTTSTIQLLRDLFEPLTRHPYIYPVTDVGVLAQKPFVFVVEPFHSKGTLKDLIYKRKPREVWARKYRNQGKALNVLEIKVYGRQILKAMLFLHSKGIPTNGHVHSGNIFVKRGVCRISGYEQAILGFKSRLHPRLSKLLKKNKYAIDTLCFGHLLYEMSYGQELFDAKPGKLHYEFCSRSVEVGEILKFVFGTEDSVYPDLNEILYHRFFQVADGVDPIDPDSIFFKPQVTRNILKPFKKHFRKMKKRSGKDRNEEAEESPDLLKKSSHVSYETGTEQISNPILHKRIPPIVITSPEETADEEISNVPTYKSSDTKHDSSSDTKYVPSPYMSRDESSDAKYDRSSDASKEQGCEESRGEPTRPQFGVEALMDSIKQAIQKRHDAFELSDEVTTRRSSFSSTPPDSPTNQHVPSESGFTVPSENASCKPPLPAKPVPSKSTPSAVSESSQAHRNIPAPDHKSPKISPKSKQRNGQGTERSDLLKSITEGTTLRKTVTNDRSAPQV